jgi:type I restriction enzyme M protein
VLFGSTGAHRALRAKLLRENQLNAVISLPGGVFQPYTGVKTSILVFVKGGSTDQVWFYEVGADGLGLNARRTPQPEQNDLWDLTLKYRLRFGQPAPAFVDRATWRVWVALDPAERSRHYARPIIAREQRETREDEGRPAAQTSVFEERERVDVALFKGLELTELAEPKDWTATLDAIEANDGNLSAGRYKPMIASARTYAKPADILVELRAIEEKILAGVDALLRKVEGVE